MIWGPLGVAFYLKNYIKLLHLICDGHGALCSRLVRLCRPWARFPNRSVSWLPVSQVYPRFALPNQTWLNQSHVRGCKFQYWHVAYQFPKPCIVWARWIQAVRIQREESDWLANLRRWGLGPCYLRGEHQRAWHMASFSGRCLTCFCSDGRNASPHLHSRH